MLMNRESAAFIFPLTKPTSVAVLSKLPTFPLYAGVNV